MTPDDTLDSLRTAHAALAAAPRAKPPAQPGSLAALTELTAEAQMSLLTAAILLHEDVPVWVWEYSSLTRHASAIASAIVAAKEAVPRM